jgi:hypothetical protein
VPLLAAGWLLATPAVLAAQERTPLVLEGRLLLVAGTDSAPLPRSMVVAHRVNMQAQGPVDSARTDAAGRFRIRIASPESTTVYVVSADHAGIGYFSEPFSHEARDGAGAITLAVFDTTTGGPPLHVTIRHLVVERMGTGGSRRVLDLIQVNNPGTRTRVAADSLAAVWTARLPAGVEMPSVGPGELPESAVIFVAGRVEVAAAFPPGQKQVVLTYVLPAGVPLLSVPIDQPTARFEVIVEGDAEPRGSLSRGEPLTLDGRQFTRFSATALSAGAEPGVRLSDRGGRSGAWVAALAAALALAALWFVWHRRRSPQSPRAVTAEAGTPGAAPAPAQLVNAIAALDDRYEGREHEVGPAEWAEYRTRRAELKAQLAARVARG